MKSVSQPAAVFVLTLAFFSITGPLLAQEGTPAVAPEATLAARLSKIKFVGVLANEKLGGYTLYALTEEQHKTYQEKAAKHLVDKREYDERMAPINSRLEVAEKALHFKQLESEELKAGLILIGRLARKENESPEEAKQRRQEQETLLTKMRVEAEAETLLRGQFDKIKSEKAELMKIHPMPQLGFLAERCQILHVGKDYLEIQDINNEKDTSIIPFHKINRIYIHRDIEYKSKNVTAPREPRSKESR